MNEKDAEYKRITVRDEINMISFLAQYTSGLSSNHCYSSWLYWSENSLSIFFMFTGSFILVVLSSVIMGNVPKDMLYLPAWLSLFSLLTYLILNILMAFIFIDKFYKNSKYGKEIQEMGIGYFTLLKNSRTFAKELCMATEPFQGEAVSIEEILEKDGISLFDDLSTMIVKSLK